MNYRRLGKAGIKLSELSLGAWVTYGGQVGVDVARDCMVAAYEHGVNFFDNAEGYANGEAETVMGQVLKQSGWPRESVVISTKLYWGGSGPNDTGLSHKHLLEGIHRSLKRLQLDYVDLLFCHRPDPNTPIEETVRAMDLLIKQGKIFYWGTSEWSAADIMGAWQIAERHHLRKPVVEQPEYNLFHRQRVEVEYARLYDEIGLGLTTWSPLASGLLTGKYRDGVPKDSRGAIPRMSFLLKDLTDKKKNAALGALDAIAKELGCTLAQLALAWCARNPHVSTVITGASRVSQVQENMKAAAIVPKLTRPVLDRIDAATAGLADLEG